LKLRVRENCFEKHQTVKKSNLQKKNDLKFALAACRFFFFKKPKFLKILKVAQPAAGVFSSRRRKIGG